MEEKQKQQPQAQAQPQPSDKGRYQRIKGPRLKTVPFAPFSKSFLPEGWLRKVGFIASTDQPYERNTATRSTHNEYYDITLDSMFGAPSPKILRLDSLRERFVISETEKGRGPTLKFSEIKSIRIDDLNPTHVTVKPVSAKTREMKFNMKSADVTTQFVQRLETLVQAKKMRSSNK